MKILVPQSSLYVHGKNGFILLAFIVARMKVWEVNFILASKKGLKTTAKEPLNEDLSIFNGLSIH